MKYTQKLISVFCYFANKIVLKNISEEICFAVNLCVHPLSKLVFIFICKIVKLQDIENGSAKGSTPNVLDYKDGGIYDEIEKDSATPTKNGKPNGTAHSTEDVYAVPDKRKSNPPESPKLGTPKYIMVSNCIYYYIQVQSLTPSNCRLLIAEIFKQHSNLICLYT